MRTGEKRKGEDAARICERRESQPRESTSVLVANSVGLCPSSAPLPYLNHEGHYVGQALLVGDTLLSIINVKEKASPPHS